MLYTVSRSDPDEYPYVIHLRADLRNAVKWANKNGRKWVFTDTNAGSYQFSDSSQLDEIDDLDWESIKANHWSDPDVKKGKQAEFLVEEFFPWKLIDHIGTKSDCAIDWVEDVLESASHKPEAKIRPRWYYC